jgi:hypothetical protein
MSTTTIRLSKVMKVRVARAAARAGTTTQKFILQAIAEKTQMDELNSNVNASANRRYANIVATGRTISWNDMKAYLVRRMAGEPAERPAASDGVVVSLRRLSSHGGRRRS